SLWVTEGTVEKHVHSILAKLQLAETDDDHRRVLAVITFLDAQWRPLLAGAGVTKQAADRGRRKIRLGHEADGGAGRDQISEIRLIVRRNEDRGRPAAQPFHEPARQLEAALSAEVDVDEDNIGRELLRDRERLLAALGGAYDLDSLALEQVGCRPQHAWSVVDDHAPQTHGAEHDARAARRPFPLAAISRPDAPLTGCPAAAIVVRRLRRASNRFL